MVYIIFLFNSEGQNPIKRFIDLALHIQIKATLKLNYLPYKNQKTATIYYSSTPKKTNTQAAHHNCIYKLNLSLVAT